MWTGFGAVSGAVEGAVEGSLYVTNKHYRAKKRMEVNPSFFLLRTYAYLMPSLALICEVTSVESDVEI